MRQVMFPRYILKIESEEIINNNYQLNIDLSEAKSKDKLISISDSQVVRWIDDIKGFRRDISQIKYKSLSIELKKRKKLNERDRIKEIYSEIDELQYIPELINIVMSKPNDIEKLKKGFTINEKKFTRFIGSPNQVKKSVVMYSSMTEQLNKFVESGKKKDYKIVPAKYEAYKALTLSGSSPVTNTRNILVVNDLVTSFYEDAIYLDDSNTDEPTMVYKNAEIKLDESDGYGLITPDMIKVWSKDLGLDYVMSGCCIRYLFTKGMLCTFDFREFARVHNKRYVTDVWGEIHDIENIDIILTTSMLKLWDAYDNITDYLDNCDKNKYSFCVTKTTPKKLDETRTLNYQYIQSYELSDDEICKLISPTVSEIKDIIHGDINKSLLFLKGIDITSKNATSGENNWIKALCIDERMKNDSYVIDRINSLISKKIQDAKIGILRVKGNYAIVIGDPYALCQKIFNIDVDNDNYGLLKAGEIYHKFWYDRNVQEVVCYRSPMSCANNIRKVKIAHTNDMSYWYKHCSELMLLNCHDSFCHALNGCDKDADIIFTTNNEVLMNNHKTTSAIMCVQRTASQKIPNEDNLRASNKASFGNDIGTVTNRVTAMYDIASLYSSESKEYKELQYRIMCGQLYQQNAIDGTKGIIVKNMPKEWYNKKAINKIEDEEKRNFYLSICVDKKPYFMRYIYPDLNREYNNFIKGVHSKCKMLFGCTLDELCKSSELTDEQANFIENYYKYIPVYDNNSTMNRLCHMVEDAFDSYKTKVKSEVEFDYEILKSGVDYSNHSYAEIEKLYGEFTIAKQEICKNNKTYRIAKEDFNEKMFLLKEEFKRKCRITVPDEKELCDIVLDICYTKEKSKGFAWDICSDQIIENLLEKNDNKIKYIAKSETGSISYQGYNFEERSVSVVNS